MSEKIERNPRINSSLGSGGSSPTLRDTPSSNTLTFPSSSPGSETWVENPEAHFNNSPSSSNPQSSSHTSVTPKLITSNLRPNDKPGDGDRPGTSREEGDVGAYYRD